MYGDKALIFTRYIYGNGYKSGKRDKESIVLRGRIFG